MTSLGRNGGLRTTPTGLQKLQLSPAHRCGMPRPSRGRAAPSGLLCNPYAKVLPRTVRKYIPKRLDHGGHQRIPAQRWLTFVRNHAKAIVACDFCAVVTATFKTLYVFVVWNTQAAEFSIPM